MVMFVGHMLLHKDKDKTPSLKMAAATDSMDAQFGGKSNLVSSKLLSTRSSSSSQTAPQPANARVSTTSSGAFGGGSGGIHGFGPVITLHADQGENPFGDGAKITGDILVFPPDLPVNEHIGVKRMSAQSSAEQKRLGGPVIDLTKEGVVEKMFPETRQRNGNLRGATAAATAATKAVVGTGRSGVKGVSVTSQLVNVPKLLSIDRPVISDVVGNLGPPSVVTNDNMSKLTSTINPHA